MTSPYDTKNTKFIIFRGLAIKLSLGADGLWRAFDGTIFALRDGKASVDKIDRCGVGMFAWPRSVDHPLSRICKGHDFMYESPAYQVFNTRQEADYYLKAMIAAAGVTNWWGILAAPYCWLARLFGGRHWENDETR